MKNIRVTELDFDTIKNNLKEFLRGQAQFSDFDFEGSGLAVLIDLLSYNTAYNAFLSNMLANESFLDSAVKRESVVSIAKNLQYVPRSYVGAVALVDVTYGSQPGSPGSLTIPRYSIFQTSIDNVTYKFLNTEPVTALVNLGQYIFNNLELKEGVQVTNSYVVGATPGPAEKFLVQNKQADVTTIRVRVQESASDTTQVTFSPAADVDITEITGDDSVYFIEENPFGKFEIFFGDGNIGKLLEPGNLVFIDYLVVSGEGVNVSSTLGASQAFSGPSLNSVAPTVVTLEPPNGGRGKEAIEEIRFNAPRAYASQNRLVTPSDYSAIIKRLVPNVKAVSVWGGEEESPPQYGKCFISILPTSGNSLTPQVKSRIINQILKQKRVVAITPVIVDPDFYYVSVETSVKYDSAATIKTPDEIRSAVEDAVEEYFDDNLANFEEDFLYSRFLAQIDSADAAILGNQTKIKIQKRLQPSLRIANNIRVQLNNTLAEGTLNTTRFVYEKNGVLVQARIRDVPEAATIEKSGTYRRSGSIITCTFTSAHGLTAGETAYLDFTGAASAGNYEIYKVISTTSFSVISTVTGSTNGSVFVTSKPRGSLLLYNPINQETLLPYVGFVSYEEGIVQIENLYVKGYINRATDVRLTISLTEDSKDIVFERNQILLLDDSTSNTQLDQAAGLTVTVVPVA